MWSRRARVLAENTWVQRDQTAVRALEAREALTPLLLQADNLSRVHVLAVQRLEIGLRFWDIVRICLV